MLIKNYKKAVISVIAVAMLTLGGVTALAATAGITLTPSDSQSKLHNVHIETKEVGAGVILQMMNEKSESDSDVIAGITLTPAGCNDSDVIEEVVTISNGIVPAAVTDQKLNTSIDLSGTAELTKKSDLTGEEETITISTRR